MVRRIQGNYGWCRSRCVTFAIGIIDPLLKPFNRPSNIRMGAFICKQLTSIVEFLKIRVVFSETVSDFKVFISETNQNKVGGIILLIFHKQC